MTGERDNSEVWPQYGGLWLHFGEPPSENDEKYPLKLLMYQMKDNLSKTATDLYRARIYELLSPRIELPAPSSFFSKKDFSEFFSLHPSFEEIKIKKVNKTKGTDKSKKEIMNKIKIYHRQCEMMIDEIKTIEKYAPPRTISEAKAYRTINKATELLYECGKFIGYWTGLKERSQAAAIGPGAFSAKAGKETKEIVKQILDKYGGIIGFMGLPRGKKTPVKKEIAEGILAKDGDIRQVDNILKEFKKNVKP